MISGMNSGCSKFAILAAPRTGSNMLCTMLNSHPRILCHHEIFNPDGIFYALDLRDGDFSLGSRSERDRDPLGFLQRVWDRDLGHSRVGFKMTLRQNEAVFDAVLHDPGVRKIILHRRNRVKTYVSWLIAQQTGQWEVYRKADVVSDRPKVRVEAAAFYDHLARNDEYYAQIERTLDETGQQALNTDYERLFGDDELRRILSFLEVGLDTADWRSAATSVRQNPIDLRQLICNFEDLESAWGESPLGRELHSLEY
jgi:LPS sulfotransferase NodH